MNLEKLFSLEGDIAVVTGATGQLGNAFSQGFLDAGAKVIGLDVNLSGKKIDGVEYLECDISKRDNIQKVFGEVFEKYGKVNHLVNNAGVSTFEPFEDRPEDRFDWVMDINLKGTFFCIQEFVKLLDEKKITGGSIVNIASMYGMISPDFRIYTDCDRKNSEVYGATKAGVIQMTRYFAAHLASRNIRVNAISPGGVLNEDSPQGEDFQNNYGFRCPMKRMAKAQEMVGACIYLSSKSSSYTTGTNIVVDGGMSCW